jgi:predicted membrane channel-forming protein YqfA (hemolysin III family)
VKRQDINYAVSILLLASICITAITGYVQSQLDLRRFVPHRYFAYITLGLAAVHVYLNMGKIWRYLRGKLKTKK